MKKLTVIVPVYNAEKTLTRCIDSIISQSYENIEIILINDGSSDKSLFICNQYKNKDKRIKVIDQENRGAAAAKNAGIDAAAGDYITFVDSDDYILPNAYKTMMEKALETDAEITVCLWQWMNLDGSINPLDEEVKQFKTEVVSGKEFLQKHLYASPYHNGVVVSLCNKIIKAKHFGNHRSEGRFADDESLINKIIGLETKVAIIAEAFYVYTHNQSSITNSPFSLARLNMLNVLLQRAEVLQSVEDLHFHTLKLYCDLTMEYYIEPAIKGNGKHMQRYIKEYKRVYKQIKGQLNGSFKRRAGIFAVSPRLYRFILKIRKK